MRHQGFTRFAQAAFVGVWALAAVAAQGQTAALTNASQETAAVKSYEGTYYLPAGSAFIVTGEGESVRLRAVGQEAVNLVHHAAYGDTKRLDAFNKHAARVIEGLVGGDMKPLRSVLKERRRAQGGHDLSQLIDVMVDAYGPLQSYEIVGTVPRAQRFAVTYADLDFERASVTVRFDWNGRELITIRRSAPMLFTLKARPLSAGHFAASDAMSGKPVTFTFEPDASGSLGQLVVEGPQKAVARRTTSLAAQ